MNQTTAVAQTNDFIILEHYSKLLQSDDYQSEGCLEREFIADLQNQGYEYRTDLTTHSQLLANVRTHLERLNEVCFSDGEWERFVNEFLDSSNETVIDKTRKIHESPVKDFSFDSGELKNIYLLKKDDLHANQLEVINQFVQTGTHENRYDVTILVNGLPLVHIELKKRGVAIREAFNQIHRYQKESFNAKNSLFRYIQMFVISNGTDTRYFANTTKRDKNSFDFSMNWATADNQTIKDLKDFTATFLQKSVLLKVLFDYCVFDTSDTLLIMRPYQIAATERILWKINSAHHSKSHNTTQGGGYIWHTTGSGKTLTSFKAAQLATRLPFVDKVFFVVDRKDLDYQTMKEYQRFSPDSVNGSNSTQELKRNLQKQDNKIVVTTIQKLNHLIKSEKNLPIYDQEVVFIFDECHRSQFGEAQANIQKHFKRFLQFGFTGTPILKENATSDWATTAAVFGSQLHRYIITDAIRDEKVLKFKVDYNDVRPNFKTAEQEQDLEKLSALENKQVLLHPKRIEEVSRYILDNFNIKTHRLINANDGFNALFAVSSVDAAKLYYETLQNLQKDRQNPLKIATIFSYAANEEGHAVGELEDENFEPTALNSSAKEFLAYAIGNYNQLFSTNFGVESTEFQNYYRDVSQRMKNRQIDLLIVVGMFLTGFDAPRLNTLFVDKNLRYHGLIQAYSRTNRIYDSTKSLGNIVTFRDLQKATTDALRLFGDDERRCLALEKSFMEHIKGFSDTLGEQSKGYQKLVHELKDTFPDPDALHTEADKKAFVKTFGDYLKVENILQNFDEFTALKVLQTIDPDDKNALAALQQTYQLDTDMLATLQTLEILTPRQKQNYLSTYHDIREWLGGQKQGDNQSTIDWSDVVFEVALLKSQEINLDYIITLIGEKRKTADSKDGLIKEIRQAVRSSLSHRAKEPLLVDFIEQNDLSAWDKKEDLIDAFYQFAQEEQKKQLKELIKTENLHDEPARRYIKNSLKRGYASENGTELQAVLPNPRPLDTDYTTKKNGIFAKIATFVERFVGIGGEV